jgi:hypothetical protein
LEKLKIKINLYQSHSCIAIYTFFFKHKNPIKDRWLEPYTGETKREGQYILIFPRSGLLVQEKIGQVHNEEENEIWAANKTRHQNPLFLTNLELGLGFHELHVNSEGFCCAGLFSLLTAVAGFFISCRSGLFCKLLA